MIGLCRRAVRAHPMVAAEQADAALHIGRARWSLRRGHVRCHQLTTLALIPRPGPELRNFLDDGSR
jgi:hypothetical protein